MFSRQKYLSSNLWVGPEGRIVIWILVFAFSASHHDDAEARKGALGGALNRAMIKGSLANDQNSVAQLSYEELLNCINQQNQLKAEQIGLKPREVSIEATATKLNELDIRLSNVESKIKQMDKAGLQSPEDIESYNSQVDRFNKMIIGYQELFHAHESRVKEFNKDIGLFNSTVSVWNASCDGKSYFQDDFDRAMESL
jgi:uncharacterized protein (DUF3084 family)